ncbi:MAG: transcription termination factor NusA [Candidatus Omnitrophica bacterium]|nr:transcription termination factor NusA [Candidatus Omnitrophota bacterium]
MNGELLSVLDHLEREKGIDREVLIAAVESALVSAAKKALGSQTEDVEVKMDRKSGEVTVFSGGKEVKSGDFGRIAAQTAKQIIIQKIREAERDVIFTDYNSRVGNVVTGTVYRFEKGNIIVDLGKTEGFIPKSEQSSKENFRQGDRIKAFVVEVKKTGKGPQIVLSRANTGLVKKLFELEIPEIYEGIVEIKSISREAGDRTKIAVFSKDEKIDCVGACVGMRGSRVKNIVKELQGEKIDIVRWSDDTKEYILASLNPAKISTVKLDKEAKRAQVTVDDDQLSLAIGKKGQNVRLASKLTGWEIDIKPKAALLEGAPAAGKKEAEPEAKEAGKEDVAQDISSLEGVGPKTKGLLEEAGLDSIEKIAASSVEELTKIKGIGEKTAEKILKSAKGLAK